MKQITITRDSNGDVHYQTVTVQKNIENVFFLNEDSESEHWPTISANRRPNRTNRLMSQKTTSCGRM